MHNSPYDIFSGQWSFNKAVSPSNTTIIGIATFVEEGNRKQFKEQGIHNINGTAYPCHQSYIYEFRKDQIRIYKHNEELLHQFDIPSGSKLPLQSKHTHVCGQDSYACNLLILAHDNFQLHYQILGPNKNYTMLSNFEKISN